MSAVMDKDWKDELKEADILEEEEHNTFRRKIGNRITSLRIEKDINESELSRAIGRNKTYIQGIASGKSYPSMKSFMDICRYFDITPKEFFSEEAVPDKLVSKNWIELKKLVKLLQKEDIDLLIQMAKRMIK